MYSNVADTSVPDYVISYHNLLGGAFCCHPGQVLLKTMLKPLVMYPSLSVTVTEQQDEGVALALQCLEESSEERSAPSQVYSKLLLVLKTLHTHLLGTKGVEVCGDYLSCCQTAQF